MINFKLFLEMINIDSSEIEKVYNKSKISVNLVKKLRPKLLEKISIIGNIATTIDGKNIFGVYTYWKTNKGKPITLTSDTNNSIPINTIKSTYPNFNIKNLKKGEIIRLNIKNILKNSKTDLDAVIKIAGVIVHEAVHANEILIKKLSSEVNPTIEQNKFLNEVNNNQIIIKELEIKIKQLGPSHYFVK